MTVIEAPPLTHEEEWERIIEELRSEDPVKKVPPPKDCPLCHTGRTRPCHCGGRVHNEMQGGVFVESCFSRGSCPNQGWHPAAE